MRAWPGIVTALLALIVAPHTGAAEAKRGAACKLLPAAAGPRLAECRGKIHASQPDFVFVFTGRRNGPDQRIANAIDIRRSDRKSTLQTLARPGWDIEVPVGGNTKARREEKGAIEFYALADLRFVLADINFDGYADIRVFASANQGCEFNNYWLFDPAKGRYGSKLDEQQLAIGGLQCGTITFDAKRREVRDRRLAMRYHQVYLETAYRWLGTRLEKLRARVTVIAKSGRCRARLYRFVAGKPRGTGYRDCPRDKDGGNRYSPPDAALARPKTFDQWIK
jgi:hypothetical protein